MVQDTGLDSSSTPTVANLTDEGLVALTTVYRWQYVYFRCSYLIHSNVTIVTAARVQPVSLNLVTLFEVSQRKSLFSYFFNIFCKLFLYMFQKLQNSKQHSLKVTNGISLL